MGISEVTFAPVNISPTAPTTTASAIAPNKMTAMLKVLILLSMTCGLSAGDAGAADACAAAGVSGAPQFPQNLLPGGAAVPHCGHWSLGILSPPFQKMNLPAIANKTIDGGKKNLRGH
jgi:hypothetical protein